MPKPESELAAFHDYVAKLIDRGETELSPEDALARWRESRRAFREAVDEVRAELGEEDPPE